MIKLINQVGVKEFVLGVLYIITFITVMTGIIVEVGYDTLIVRSLITLIPIGIGSIAAFIAYKNFEAGKVERRKQYYLKYFIDSFKPVETLFDLHEIKSIVFREDNYSIIYHACKKKIEYKYEELIKSNLQYEFDISKKKEYDHQTLDRKLRVFLDRLHAELITKIGLINSIHSDKIIQSAIDKEELIIIIVERKLKGTLTYRDGLKESIHHKIPHHEGIDSTIKELKPIFLEYKNLQQLETLFDDDY